MATRIPDPYYVAFIDEAGDPGLKAVRPVDPAGGTEWLCLGAVLTSVKNEAALASWVQSALAKAGARNRSELHYRNLADHQKRIVVSEMAQLPVRSFVLASNKNMRGYRNERAEQVRSQQWFYNFCLRLLLERVTDCCYLHAKSNARRIASSRSSIASARSTPIRKLPHTTNCSKPNQRPEL